jgi:hypothetical protein
VVEQVWGRLAVLECVEEVGGQGHGGGWGWGCDLYAVMVNSVIFVQPTKFASRSIKADGV